jgi:membrane-anchored glycerophosphoryl diester phosphodiesterase (GDPDase)
MIQKTIDSRIIIVCLIIFINAYFVSAYLDPGTGSMIIQILIGGIVATGIFVKTKWYQIKSFVKGVKNKFKTSKNN